MSQPFPHGTTNGYNNLGCRCADCRAANAAAHRDYMTRRRGLSRNAAQPTPQTVAATRDCGRPYDVLRYIDFCLDPKRPLVMDLCGGPGETWRVLREAEAGLRAANERVRATRAVVAAQRKLVEALTELESALV